MAAMAMPAAEAEEAAEVGRDGGGGGAVAVAEGGSLLVIMEGEALATRLEVEDVLGTNGLSFLSEPFCFCWWL